ncbi:ribonuclease H-like domain-containing protein [Cubamyces lactineus]|nr:ribonuclease H-like domain-containing protein [Cubamyces lactineus]
MPTDPEVSFYAIAKGRKPGIYVAWADCKAQVLNYYGAKYKKCRSPHEAKSWLEVAVDAAAANEAFDAFLAQYPEYLVASSFDIENLSGVSVPLPTSPAPALSYPDLAMPRPTKKPARPSDADALAELVATPVRPATPADPVASANTVTVGETKQAGPLLPRQVDHEPNDGEPLIVYSDGACRGNGQPGSVAGVGVWWGPDHPWNICERCPGGQTNNRAELIAIIRVLETAPMDQRELIIKTDSHYSISCLETWLDNWKRNGWKKANGGPVNNVALIRYADIMLQERRNIVKQPVKFVKVKGHSGDVGNDGADRLAVAGATLPEAPERDWEDLIAQVNARMTMPPQSRVMTGPTNTPPAEPSTSTMVSPVLPSSSQGTNPRIATSLALPKQPSKPTAPHSAGDARELAPSLGDSRRQTDQVDSKAEIPPNEWELYAACALSDDDFLREIQEMGL